MQRLPCLLIAGWALLPAIGMAQPAPPSWIDKKQEYEEWLAAAEVIDIEDVGEGVTNPKKATLKMGDTVFHAVYKPLK